jgi:hypothetical protein
MLDRYAFYDQDGVVKTIITANASQEEIDLVFRDYKVLHNAVGFDVVTDQGNVSVGSVRLPDGSYRSPAEVVE